MDFFFIINIRIKHLVHVYITIDLTLVPSKPLYLGYIYMSLVWVRIQHLLVLLDIIYLKLVSLKLCPGFTDTSFV